MPPGSTCDNIVNRHLFGSPGIGWIMFAAAKYVLNCERRSETECEITMGTNEWRQQ